MRRRLLTALCAGAVLGTAPAALADDGQTLTGSWQTPTDTRFAQVAPVPAPVFPPAPSSPDTPNPPVPGRGVCFAAVPLPGFDASTPLAPSGDTTLADAADKNLTNTGDTLLANWWGNDGDVWRSTLNNQTSRRVEGKQPLLLTLSTGDTVRAKPNPLRPGMGQTKVAFTTNFTARKVDQDNCVTDEVPVDSLAIHSKVSFGGRVDGVGQPKRVDAIPGHTMLTDEPMIGSTWWQVGHEIKNDSLLQVRVDSIPAEGAITGVHHQVTGDAVVHGQPYRLTTTDVGVTFP